MFTTNGTNGVAFPGAAFPTGNFTLALWFKATSQVSRTLFGVATAGQAQYFKAVVTSGDLDITLDFAGGNYGFAYYGSDLLDGTWRVICIRRSGATMTVRIDGVFPDTAAEGGTIDASALPFTVPMGLGAVNVNGTDAEHYAADFGQWALWNSALTDAQMLRLACGENPANIGTPLEYWRCFDTTLDSSGELVTFSRGNYSTTMIGGYHLFCTMDDTPEIGVDAPFMRLASGATDAEIDEAIMALTAEARANVAISAFGLGGYSDLVHASFLTDVDSHPLHVPSPVVIVRVETLSGGRVRTSWIYDELLEALAVADNFRIEFTPEDGQTPVADVDVASRAPARQYSHTSEALEDGEWTIRVYSEKDGNYRSPVDGATAIADGTAPTGDVEALEVV